MIDLGLGRITSLLKLLENPHLSGWKAIHVAGTNGKGSVCAYISSTLYRANISTGRFTSPHLINKWDCISIDETPVREDVFKQSEKYVNQINHTHNIGATEFELLTATAFDIFRKLRVEIAVVEVGVGGKLDATNVLSTEQTLATVITKVGLDHQNLLGSTLREIGREKAGIIKPGVSCVVDLSNDQDVLDSILDIAREKSSKMILAKPNELLFNVQPDSTPLLGAYQVRNLSCALNALSIVSRSYPQITPQVVQEGVEKTVWPGRLQWLQLEQYDNKHILLDGAHNKQAAELLANYINEISSLRKQTPNQSVSFVFAFSQGKDFTEVLKCLLKPQDKVIVTSFDPVDGMPWVKPCLTEEVAQPASELVNAPVLQQPGIEEVLKKIPDQTVICGSLYLIGDVLRKNNNGL